MPERIKLPQITSPKGTFKYPALSKPDFGNKDFPKPQGVYKAGLILTAGAPDTTAFLKKLQPHYEAALEAARVEFSKLKPETRKKLKDITENALFTELLDKETEEPTGDISFNFSMNASGTYKNGQRAGETWTRKPAIFDARAKQMTAVPDIWGGTTGRITFEVSPYFIPGTGAAGVSLRLQAVQVIDLVSGGVRSAGDYGFGEEEGYEHEDKPVNAAGFADETGAAAGGGDDF